MPKGKYRNRPTELGREAGKHLARFCDQAETERMTLRPRCTTCAFRLGTYANGCAATVLDATKCWLENKPFVCHESKAGKYCAGWLMIRTKTPIEVRWPFIGGTDLRGLERFEERKR